ncbi:EAL domain-containing protein [Marinomonas sp.]
MHSVCIHCTTIDSLLEEIKHHAQPALVQMYGTLTIAQAKLWADQLARYFPDACRIGMASERHICNGLIKESGVTLIFSYFDSCQLVHKIQPYHPEQPSQSGEALFSPFLDLEDPHHTTGFLVLMDSQYDVKDDFFDVTREYHISLSGGRAGYGDHKNSWLLFQGDLYQDHALCVGFITSSMAMQRNAFVDNITIGRHMLVTSSEGHILKQIDHLPAQQIYQRYLSNGGNITLPLINRFALRSINDGIENNAVPLDWADDGGLIMSEPLPEGAHVQFIYFHPEQALHSAVPEIQHLYDNDPESVIVFNCMGRNDFQGEVANNKLALLNQVQPVHGTYCYGEFFSTQFGARGLQHALTYVAFKESDGPKSTLNKVISAPDSSDSLVPMFNLINNTFQDISQERKSIGVEPPEHFQQDWLYDLQTGLLNRFSLIRNLTNHEDTEHLAVIRIRNFRLINQQYGYSAADNVLAQLAQYLKFFLGVNSVGIEFTCYRLSANEVAVAINSPISSRRVIRLFRGIAEDIENQEFLTSEKVESLLSLSLTVGLASRNNFNGEPICPTSHLLIKASEARRFAQINSQPIFWSGDLPTSVSHDENLDWIQKIRKALENNDVVAYFQPYYDSQTGQEIGAEALLRARIDDAIVSPFMFLELIKQTQLYPKITQTMLSQCERILHQNPSSHIALNLSVLDFKHQDTLKALRHFFRNEQFKGRVTLEITESESIQDYDWISPLITEFRQAGALLAIDDFGAGYSNLEKLIALDPDILKLDGCIIKTIDSDEKLQKLVKHINNLAHSLDIKTQAEFVHNEAVYNMLVDMGVDYLQGYHLSQPVDEITWLRS